MFVRLGIPKKHFGIKTLHTYNGSWMPADQGSGRTARERSRVAEAPGAIGDAPQLARLTRTPHREPPRKVDKAGGGDNPEGATDTRVGNSSRTSGGRLGMGDSAAASEGGDDKAALQAQRKRPRTSSNGEVALV
jgi:hypothetical protein